VNSERATSGESVWTAKATAELRIAERLISDNRSILRLTDGSKLESRRFVPVGKGDALRLGPDSVEVFVRQDLCWVCINPAWEWRTKLAIGPELVDVTFKEIETLEEMARFDSLRRFHYRGGGGAGRVVPLIAKNSLWDLPVVLGFIELSSSMIANTARKHFFDHPYFESPGISWKTWDTSASKRLSNTIVRISRFVIHPELRGLGLAQHFISAARRYARERWHYGGRRARFIEITADMLRYYRFLPADFALMGETQGNEHRLVRDMTYLVKKALSEGTGMPQGGGGIMTLQRGYASRLLRYLNHTGRPLAEVVRSLQHNPALLDQDTWEELHRLNRKPKLTYIAGLTDKTRDYITQRQTVLGAAPKPRQASSFAKKWSIRKLTLTAKVEISQTSEARTLQDAFGFVGSDLATEIIDDLSFDLKAGELTLVCGASGSGKSLLLSATECLLSGTAANLRGAGKGTSLDVKGEGSETSRLCVLPILPSDKTPLELCRRGSLEEFIEVSAKCGLAEPQLFVRPVHTLSSGQKYRLRVALAFLSGPEILLIDNFCEPLDRYTAIAVVRGLKRLAAERRVAIMGATATYDRDQLVSLSDQTILLRRGEPALIRRREDAA
jgi:ABC-type lipoprotein export system ATPase subunit/GNAT superfamily N-acetyltransferase